MNADTKEARRAREHPDTPGLALRLQIDVGEACLPYRAGAEFLLSSAQADLYNPVKFARGVSAAGLIAETERTL